MKYLIIGRTGSGKDYMAKILSEKYNLKILKSYTTRPQRNEQDDGHTFITPEEAATIADRIAEWKLDNDIEYFATKQQVRDNDIYIINPEAAIRLYTNMVELVDLKIIYINAPSYRKRQQAAIRRAADKKKEREVFQKRNLAENIEFCRFEELIYNEKNLAELATLFPGSTLITVNNFYDEDSVNRLINLIENPEDFELSITEETIK